MVFDVRSTELEAETPKRDVQISMAGSKVYHQGFKPTASDVKAIPESGGDVSGFLNVTGQNDRQYRITRSGLDYTGEFVATDQGVFIRRRNTDGELRSLGVRPDGDAAYYDGQWRRLYHENFKPTAADVGALPITGGVINGSLEYKTKNISEANFDFNDLKDCGSYNIVNVSNSENGPPISHCVLTVTGSTELNYVFQSAIERTSDKWFIRTYHRSNDLWSDWAPVYTGSNKPTAADVKARSDTWVPAWGEVTGKPSTFPPSTHTHPELEGSKISVDAPHDNPKKGDVYFLRDYCKDWTALPKGLSTGITERSIHSLVASGDVILGGMDSGSLSMSKDKGRTWYIMIGIPTGSQTVNALVASEGVFVAGMDSGYATTGKEDGAWEALPRGLNSGAITSSINALAASEGVFVAGMSLGYASISEDWGRTWEALPQGLNSGALTSSINALAASEGVLCSWYEFRLCLNQ